MPTGFMSGGSCAPIENSPPGIQTILSGGLEGDEEELGTVARNVPIEAAFTDVSRAALTCCLACHCKSPYSVTRAATKAIATTARNASDRYRLRWRVRLGCASWRSVFIIAGRPETKTICKLRGVWTVKTNGGAEINARQTAVAGPNDVQFHLCCREWFPHEIVGRNRHRGSPYIAPSLHHAAVRTNNPAFSGAGSARNANRCCIQGAGLRRGIDQGGYVRERPAFVERQPDGRPPARHKRSSSAADARRLQDIARADCRRAAWVRF